jgi:subtilisin family serine protease
MKNKTTILQTLLMLLLSINLFSQNFEELKKTGKPSEPTFVYERPQNCALNTSFLMMDLKQNKDVDYLKNQYSLNEIDNNLYVGAFLKIDKAIFNKSNVESLGVKLNTEAGNFFTALIPINSLESLFSVQGIISVKIAEKVYSTMDSARALTNVNQVQAGTGLPQAYTGNGVIVGVIDEGFDYTHPNFRNIITQQTKISRVWEQTGINTQPLPYGTEYVGPVAILNKMRDKVDESHGTHVAGIAAGTGAISANSALRGVAYDSEIVLVSTNMTDTGIFNGIQYIFDQSTSQNKPAVINISIGGHLGPHDGTSDFDSACNSIIGPGKILVGSAGNEGGDKIHVNKTLSTGNSLFSFSVFPDSQVNYANGLTKIDIWGEAGKVFDVAVNIYNVVTNQFESFTPYINTQTNSSAYQGTIYDNDTSSSPDACSVTIVTENSNPNNMKPHATIIIDNSLQDDVFRYVLLEVRSSNGVVNAWNFGDGKGIFTDLSELNINTGATNGNTNMTVGEIGGTGNSIISVGAYTSKNSYTNFLGNSPSLDFPGPINTIASFSSKGPTADGRFKPDITAPGNVIVSSLSRFDSNYNSTSPETVYGLNDGTNNWWFGAMQGTSMSSPMVAGIIALWLQAKPNLTVAQIKTILQTRSITAGLGSLPNNTWGSGKIDAYAGIQYINQFLNIDSFDNTNNLIVYPNPTSSKVYITSKEYVSTYEIFNTLGQKVKEGNFNAVLEQEELDLTALQNGLYILNFKGEKVNKTVRIIKQ